jgi:anaerobic selenocysteine-containing dehydrogenase
MARLILAEGLFDKEALAAGGLDAEALLKELAAYDLPRVAELSGLREGQIAEVAREFAATRPALAMAGEAVAFQTNGPEAVRAVQMLNLLVGNLNRPGGVYPDACAPDGPENSFHELVSLVERMQAGRIGVALVQGDPLHAIPPATGFPQALAKVPFVVSFSSLLDDTALQADLILPDHAGLESWGDVIPLAGTREGVIGLMQPVVTPLLDSRQFPDVLLALAHGLGGVMAAALPQQTCLEMVKGSLRKRLGSPAGGGGFEATWVELLRQGGLFKTNNNLGKDQAKGYHLVPGARLPEPAQPSFAGDKQVFPLHLQVYPSIALYDGRGAPLPWLQQLPDPMTTVVWDSWVEINPQTAASLGISHGDLVEVASPQGTLRLPAVIYPAIRPDLVAIPLGQGHRGMGRYATARGVNPLALLATNIEGKDPQPAWNATRVRLTRISTKGELVTAGNQQGSFRGELIEI